MLWKIASSIKTMKNSLKKGIQEGSLFELNKPPEWLLDVYRKDSNVLTKREYDWCHGYFSKHPERLWAGIKKFHCSSCSFDGIVHEEDGEWTSCPNCGGL